MTRTRRRRPFKTSIAVGFRVAAGPRLGFGHLARCRALATALGVPPRMSVRGTAATRTAARRLGIELLASTPRRGLRGLDVLVVDDPNLQAGGRWARAARRAGVTVVAVHDAAVRPLAADLVIDGSPRMRARQQGRRRSGVRFAVLDARIGALRRQRPRRAPSVVVALGGGTHGRGVAASLAPTLAAATPGSTVAVAAGFTSGRRRPLQGARWLAPSALAPALASARVAIVGGGVTALEAAALGVPAIAVAVVPAQRPAIRALVDHGAVVDGGSLADPRAIGRLAVLANRLWTSPRQRRRLSEAGRRLVDHGGAARIATAIRAIAVSGARR